MESTYQEHLIIHNLSYYVNHSNNPNVYHNLDTDEFYAICDIDEDEELLCTYTDLEIDWK